MFLKKITEKRKNEKNSSKMKTQESFFKEKTLLLKNTKKCVISKKLEFLDLHTYKEKCKGEIPIWNPK
jgi:hypothetical protein